MLDCITFYMFPEQLFMLALCAGRAIKNRLAINFGALCVLLGASRTARGAPSEGHTPGLEPDANATLRA